MRGVWNLVGHNLPAVQPGTNPPAARVNVLAESMARMRPLAGAGAGVELQQTPDGVAVRQTRIPYLRVAKTTSAIANAAAGSYTTGTATVQGAAGGSLSDGAVTLDEVRSYHDKTIASGAVVMLAYADGAWWVVDSRSCTDLS